MTNRAEYGHWTTAGGFADASFSVIGPPELSIDKVVTPEVGVGYHEEVTYTVTMGNGGGGVAYGVRVTDTLPPEVDFVGWAPGGRPAGASEAGDEVHWLGTLAAGQDVTLEFVARHVGNYADVVVNTAEYDHISDSGSDAASFTVAGPPEFSISKVVTPEVDVAYHGQVTYTVVLSNTGPGVAYDVAVTDALPAEVEFVGWVPGGQPDGADVVEGEIGWVGTLGSGEGVTFGFVARHMGYYGELVTNRAEYGHWVTAGGYAEATFGVIEPPVLSVRKMVTPELDVAIHSEVAYTLVLHNDGIADAHATELTDALPPQVEFARWVPSGQPAGAEVEENEITWLGTVVVGVPVTFTFVATHTGDYADVVENWVQFSHASGAGSDDATFVVLDPPDLTIEKTVSPTVVLPGDPITYTIAFANTGPSLAADVIINDEMPSSLGDLSFSSSGAAVTATGPVSYTWLVQDLQAGDGGVITVTGLVDPDVEYGLWITNTATIASAMPDGNPADDESQAGIKVREGIVSVEPPSNVHTATVTANVKATAGGAVKKSSVTTRTFSVHGHAQGHLDGAFVWGSQGSQAIVYDPASEFFPGELVETSVTEAVFAGNAPVVRHVWRFRAAVHGGTGEFVESVQDLGTVNSRAVALGDLDGDGDLDAFVTNDGLTDEVWLNNGRGRFTISSQSLGAGNGRSVALADLDGDGDLDAMVTNWKQANDVWHNDGTGAFIPAPSLGNSQSHGVALGDLDGDGDIDAYVANYNEPNLIWLNDGLGGFDDSGQTLGNARSYGVRLADLDDDGDLDALVANYGDASRVWLNDGMGHFDSGTDLGATTSYDVALGDLDGDGDLDAYVANFSKPDRVWWNDGQAAFTDSLQSLGGNAYSQRVALGDVDGDNDLDAFVANYYGQADKVFLNDGTGSFYATVQALGASYGYGVDLGDVDGDGDLDAYVANGSAQVNQVWLNLSWADLGVAKSAVPAMVGLGQTVTYTLVYANNGPHRATDVVISEDVPDTLVNVAYTSTGATIVEVGPEKYTWEVQNLEPGHGGVITITGIVDDQTTGVFSLTNQVTITHEQRDAEPGNNSSEAAITVDAVRPDLPVLVEPLNGAVISDTTPVLRWQASASSDLLGYLLKLGGETVDVGDVTQHIPAPLNDGVYTWTVAAYDRVGNLSAYANAWTFRLDGTPPDPPQLLSPRDSALISDTTPALTWQSSPAPDVAGYLLKWDDGLLDLGNLTQYTPTPLADGVHTWTLAAYDGVRNIGVFTDVWSLMLDATAPDILVTVPVSGAVDVPRPAPVVITFTEPVEPSSFAYNVTPDPGAWIAQWDGTGSVVTLNHADFELRTTYTVTITSAVDTVGLPLARAPYSWTFTTKDLRIFLPTVVRKP